MTGTSRPTGKPMRPVVPQDDTAVDGLGRVLTQAAQRKGSLQIVQAPEANEATGAFAKTRDALARQVPEPASQCATSPK